MRRLGRSGAILATSFAISVAVFLLAELGVRAAGLTPKPWPIVGGAFKQVTGFRADPLLGNLPEPGYKGPWLGTFAVEIDDHGFRTTGYAAPESPRARVAFLGDSCTFGWGMDTGETFVARLDAIQQSKGTPQLELTNAAFPGHSAVVGEHLLRERVLPLNPDIVVIGFSANNAFRLALTSDAEGLRYFTLRKLLLRSRIFQIAASELANRWPKLKTARHRQTVLSSTLDTLRRVASLEEFEDALRGMVDDTRESDASPVFLLFPRASMISEQFRDEDAAWSVAVEPLKPHVPGQEFSWPEFKSIEHSCLDHRQLADPVGTMRQRIGEWHTVYPDDPRARALLVEGAAAYTNGDYARATERFEEALRLQPDSPLALYDLGVSRIATGDRERGVRDLVQADRLACNVFLTYNVAAWKVAINLEVPVVDLALYFQAAEGEVLFLDAAHPTQRGHEVIAEALWPTLLKTLAPPATT